MSPFPGGYLTEEEAAERMTDPSRIAALERELARVNDLLAMVGNELATSEAKLRTAESLAATARRDAFEEAAKEVNSWEFSIWDTDNEQTHSSREVEEMIADHRRNLVEAIRSLATVPRGEG